MRLRLHIPSLRTVATLIGVVAMVVIVRAADQAAGPITAANPADERPVHWAFQPVTRPAPPSVTDRAWVRNPIDAFILAPLEARGLTPNPPADKPTLLRRVTFYLTGLPPTPAEIDAFLRDESPDAYEKVVDRLLRSPHYGEAWGRHWLDVARYEQHRVRLKLDPDFHGDWKYRDYVVAAFNRDKPYDRFITEQLAGDLMALPTNADGSLNEDQYFDQLTAPAFLSIGDWFDECTDPNRLRLDIADEMINATGKAFAGLTLSCARCHDHKFDPVSIRDYYALAGIFRSTRIVGTFSAFWRDGRDRMTRPLATPEQVAANDKLRGEIDAARQAMNTLLASQRAERVARWRADEAKYRDTVKQLPPREVVTLEAELFAGFDNLRISGTTRDDRKVEWIESQIPRAHWVRYTFRLPKTGRYALELYCASAGPTPVDVEAGRHPATPALTGPITGTGGEDHWRWVRVGEFGMSGGPNALRLTTHKGPFPRLDRLRFVFLDDSWLTAAQQAAENAGLDVRLLERFAIDARQPYPTDSGIEPYLAEAQRKQLDAMRDRIIQLQGAIKHYDEILAVTDQPRMIDLPVHLGGDVYDTTQDTVPRGVPALFDGVVEHRPVPADQSGRLQLAGWLTDARNPLTARVMVNRIWQWHFGRGIVDTPNDFGTRSAQPTHPELLDWLAGEFVAHGWTVKHVQRLICTSNAYQMSAAAPADALPALRNPKWIDPANRMLWRFNRRRLEVEPIYDAMLSTIGKLPRQTQGPLDFNKSADRMMYVLTSARSPRGLGGEIRKMFAVFDYSPTGEPIARRDASATSTQALWWLNNPIPHYFAGEFADRLLAMTRLDETQRVEQAYLWALGRRPAADETDAVLQYLHAEMNDQTVDAREAWKRVCLALYSSNEFRYVD